MHGWEAKQSVTTLRADSPTLILMLIPANCWKQNVFRTHKKTCYVLHWQGLISCTNLKNLQCLKAFSKRADSPLTFILLPIASSRQRKTGGGQNVGNGRTMRKWGYCAQQLVSV